MTRTFRGTGLYDLRNNRITRHQYPATIWNESKWWENEDHAALWPGWSGIIWRTSAPGVIKRVAKHPVLHHETNDKLVYWKDNIRRWRELPRVGLRIRNWPIEWIMWSEASLARGPTHWITSSDLQAKDYRTSLLHYTSMIHVRMQMYNERNLF